MRENLSWSAWLIWHAGLPDGTCGGYDFVDVEMLWRLCR
jgi:hypothetical protein